MGAEYSPAIDMWVPASYVFTNALATLSDSQLSIVIHKTAGGTSAQAIAEYFISGSDGAHKSAHFIVGQNGTVVQCVHLVDGAGANCCADSTHNSYWNPFIAQFNDLNLCTISIEHVDPASDNSTPLTPAQQTASFNLVWWLVQKFRIPSSHIRPHNSINATVCPGNYPLSDLVAFIQQGNSYMQTQMQDVWDMFLSGINQPTVSYNTGIAASWKANYQQLNAGSPLGPEKRSVDWQGNSIQIQYFSGGLRCEWNNQTGGAKWFDVHNVQVA
jgi:hypothetical protein